MKRLAILTLLIMIGLFLFTGTLFAEKKGETSVGVLNETSFIVVQGRNYDDSSVFLYQVIDGKLKLKDTLIVDGDFSDVSRPAVRILRVDTK